MDEFLFKKSRLTLLLIVTVLAFYGWTEHRHREDIKKAAELKERMEGYERCIASLDEAHFMNHGSDEIWQTARQGCREFWFGGR